MGKKRKTPPTKVAEEEKPKVVVKNEPTEELESEEEIEEVEVEEEAESDEVEEEEEGEEGGEEAESGEESSEEEEEEGSKSETLRKLLEPFGKDQIIEFLKEAAFKDRSIIERISQLAESDPAHRKIFIHGLGWDATSEQVLSIFKPYGDIEECRVVTDKVTGRAKGYGFVLFKTRRGAQKALKERQKKIGSRMVSCQLASAGPVQESTGRKIFVANVGPQVNPDTLRSLFAKFGEIEEGPLGCDPMTGKFKGFAIFVYKTAEGCKKALEEPLKVFEGCQLQCRRATDGNRTNKSNQSIPSGSTVQQTDTTSLNYGLGVGMGPGFYGALPNANQAALMMGQNAGIGIANPMLFAALNQTGLAPSVATGFSHSIGAGQSSGNYGINSVSPSLIGNYTPQTALQGLGAYPSAQLGHSSVGATAAVPARSQSGFGSAGATFPSYFGR